VRKLLAAGLVLAAAAGGLWLVLRPRAPEAAAPPATAKARRREFASAVQATGAVKPQVGAEVRVGSRISGRVLRLHANLRDAVKKGDVIAELEKEDLEAAVAERRAELLLAETRLESLDRLLPRETEKAAAEVARWEATAAQAEREAGRREELVRQEFIARQLREEAEEKLLVARAQREAARKDHELAGARHQEQLRQARAEVDRARSALKQAEVQASYALIRAPIAGVIASVSTQEGETVAAGLSAPTFVTVVDLGRLQVDAYVDEVDIGRVRPGQRARVTVDAFPAEEFEGAVAAVYPKAVLQDNLVKYVAAVELASGFEGRLRPEMTASVSIRLETRSVLAVPSRAVKREGGRNVVWVRSGGKTEPREVRVGWKDGPWVEIASGLEEGAEVLLERPAEGGSGG
jgi:multidrug resistance efflux pump